MWLNPSNPNTCPPELLEAFKREASAEADDDLAFIDTPEDDLDDDDVDDSSRETHQGPRQRRRGPGVRNGNANHAARLRALMQKDALHTYEELGEVLESGFSAFGFAGTVDTKGKGVKRDLVNVEDSVDTLEFSTEAVSVAREFLALEVSRV